MLFLVAAWLCASPAKADCTDPAGVAGQIRYNADQRVPQYCDGTDWIGFREPNPAPPDPCAGAPAPGDQCADGSYYIGQVGGDDIYAAASDESGPYTWGGYGNNDAADSTTDGPANTDNLVADGHSHPAAQVCRDKGAGWHLPAKDELNLLYNGGSPVAGVDTGNTYWSSTEFNSADAWVQKFSDGSQAASGKFVTTLVRCVRKGYVASQDACTGPDRPAGTILYNADHHVLQFCDGEQWQAAGLIDPAGAGGSGGLTALAALSGGHLAHCGVKTDGTAWCWGNENNGELVTALSPASRIPPSR